MNIELENKLTQILHDAGYNVEWDYKDGDADTPEGAEYTLYMYKEE